MDINFLIKKLALKGYDKNPINKINSNDEIIDKEINSGACSFLVKEDGFDFNVILDKAYSIVNIYLKIGDILEKIASVFINKYIEKAFVFCKKSVQKGRKYVNI